MFWNEASRPAPPPDVKGPGMESELYVSFYSSPRLLSQNIPIVRCFIVELWRLRGEVKLAAERTQGQGRGENSIVQIIASTRLDLLSKFCIFSIAFRGDRMAARNSWVSTLVTKRMRNFRLSSTQRAGIPIFRLKHSWIQLLQVECHTRRGTFEIRMSSMAA